MRRITWIAAVIACLSIVLAGCGTKDAGSVVKELSKVSEKTGSYQGSGTMTLHTGQQPLEYKVDVKFQKPNFYRIALTNEQKDITQIVLRNDEGVFVLTPKQNKVFRFQSDWPDNQGQVYLYQTLLQSILLDNSRQFTTDKESYVFDVMANYTNASLTRQKIWLNKSNYAPQQVEVSDSNSSVLVGVKFDKFEFNPTFDASVFDTQSNLKASAAGGDQPTVATPENSNNPEGSNNNTSAPGNDSGANDANGVSNTNGSNPADQTSGITDSGANQPLVTMEPSYLPAGVAQKDVNDIQFGGNPGVMFRYSGAYNYTLIETNPKDYEASIPEGTIVDLGFTVALMSGDDQQRTLTWTYGGTEYRLTSGDLPDPEMIQVAGSVLEEMTK